MLSRKIKLFVGFIAAFGLASVGQGIHAAQITELQPEKSKLEVAIAATGPLYLPILLANEAGYFIKRGLIVYISTLSATDSEQALLSGPVDIYLGGTASHQANGVFTDSSYLSTSGYRST